MGERHEQVTTGEQDAPGREASAGVRQVRFSLGARPFLVLLELTRACALACVHCRAEAIDAPEPGELSTAELVALFEDLAALGSPRPHVVLSGGDPLRRDDLEELVAAAASRYLAVAVSPAGTPLASSERLVALREAGAGAVSFSLDGASAALHDGFRRVAGSFSWTVAGCEAAKAAGLRLQINTTVCAETVDSLPGIARLVDALGANLWSVFFLIPVGRGGALSRISAEDAEDVYAFLSDLSSVMALKTTEAPAYRRVVHERLAGRRRAAGLRYHELWEGLRAQWPEGAARVEASKATATASRRAPLAVGDGRGVVFVSRTGEVFPSGFLPLRAGSIREQPLSEIYRSSPLLQALRDPSRLGGRCGRCEVRDLCGGSRALAYAVSGDAFGEDPSCAYEPAVPVASRS